MRPRGVHRWLAVRRALVTAVVPLLLVVAAGCTAVPGSGGLVSGSGTPTTKLYDYTGFTGVRVDQAFAATVTRGDVFAVSVTVDDNLVKYLRVELDGDTLHIGLDPGKSYQGATLKAQVTLPSLGALEVTGGASADVTGFDSQDALDLQASGAASADLTGMRAGEVTIDISGASHVSGGLEAQSVGGKVSGAGRLTLEGSASSAKLEVSGAGHLDLKDFTVQDADLQLSGGANGALRVTGSLKAEASGGAHLDYYGSPTSVQTNVSGGAQVSRAGG